MSQTLHLVIQTFGEQSSLEGMFLSFQDALDLMGSDPGSISFLVTFQLIDGKFRYVAALTDGNSVSGLTVVPDDDPFELPINLEAFEVCDHPTGAKVSVTLTKKGRSDLGDTNKSHLEVKGFTFTTAKSRKAK